MSKSRREFIKKTIATAAIIPTIGASNSLFSKPHQDFSEENISNEDLLADFKVWVDHYVNEIQNEKKLGRHFKDNQALVELPAKMEEMMPVFKSRFSDEKFLKNYLKISSKLTEEINTDF